LKLVTPLLHQNCRPGRRPSRQFYDRKRGERFIHSQALLALARRLVDVLWALLRDGREFTLHSPAALAVA
jgi:hypothetical protein